ncbi:ABC transporter ATP-binding protein [Christensenellaceae bacterium OttesenSCG-928-M15]|nr:ABC transporter ATP-binding protein [Christensenellaceae bacterium OttesenSCG-928-M15]
MTKPILEVKDLSIEYQTQEFTARAVNNVSFSLNEGETLGIVGETGAGKTTTALGVMRLLPKETGRVTSGEIVFEGQDILTLPESEARKLRGGQIAMIYQDPMTSLNPIRTVGDQVAEALYYHTELDKKQISDRVDEIFELVGIQKERKSEYPHQFSGGMKQRIVIAMALACNPKVLIADEPTTALDVTIQAQVLKMMNDIKKRLGTSLIFITHDLGIIVRMCDYVAIMYAGEIIEYGSTEEIFTDYRHPYTKGLFASIPSLTKKVERLEPVPGLMADCTNLPEGCKFHPRCSACMDVCKTVDPQLVCTGGTHRVSCHLIKEESTHERANT